MKRILLALLLAVCAPLAAHATNCNPYPYTLTNGQPADANQVMANFNNILSCGNGSLAHSGQNGDITALTGLTTPISAAQGGTGNTLGTATPSGAAGGFLAGFYPNPTVAAFSAYTILANVTAGSAAPTQATGAQVNAILPAFTGDSGAGGVAGLVPAPPTGSAAAGQVLGAGGSWVLGSPQVMEVRYQLSSGTPPSETITNGAWTQRKLNTVAVNTITSATLVSNQVTLPAGTYEIWMSSTLGSAANFFYQIRLRNVIDNNTPVVSPAAYSAASSSTAQTTGSAFGRFTIAGAKVFELDCYPLGASSITGGAVLNTGEPEIYADVFIRKVG